MKSIQQKEGHLITISARSRWTFGKRFVTEFFCFGCSTMKQVTNRSRNHYPCLIKQYSIRQHRKNQFACDLLVINLRFIYRYTLKCCKLLFFFNLPALHMLHENDASRLWTKIEIFIFCEDIKFSVSHITSKMFFQTSKKL